MRTEVAQPIGTRMTADMLMIVSNNADIWMQPYQYYMGFAFCSWNADPSKRTFQFAYFP